MLFLLVVHSTIYEYIFWLLFSSTSCPGDQRASSQEPSEIACAPTLACNTALLYFVDWPLIVFSRQYPATPSPFAPP